jgi:nucleoside-diphosphate-sugar epimerase
VAQICHQFAHLPDVGRTMYQLIQRSAEPPAFTDFHMTRLWDAHGTEFGHAIQRAMVRNGYPQPRHKAFPGWLITALSPVVSTTKELLELRDLWQRKLRMDNAKLLRLLGHEPQTQLDATIEAPLSGCNCTGLATTPAHPPTQLQEGPRRHNAGLDRCIAGWRCSPA